MVTQNLSEHVLRITLPADPQSSSELEAVARSAHPGADHDVIVDFSLVESLPRVTICHLIILERVLNAAGGRLVLCCVSRAVKETFRRVGLHKLLRFADDELVARQSLDRSEYLCASEER